MTLEKKFFISPEDIVAVRFTCANCHSAVILPVGKIPNGDIGILVTRNCPHCRTPSGLNQGTRDMENVITFGLLLAGLVDNLKGKKLELSFEIECPEQF
jgi:hypothetical protein